MPSTREMTNTIRNMDQLKMFQYYYNAKAGTVLEIRREKLYRCCFHTERTASLHFHGHNGRIIFKCFGCGAGGDIFEFVKRAYGHSNFADSVREIYSRFCSYMISVAGPPPRMIDYTPKTETQIVYDEKPFTQRALAWWSYCGMTEHDLHLAHYCQARKVVITTSVKTYQIVADRNDLTFIIYYPSGRVKVYRPLMDKTRKWRSNVDYTKDLYGSWQLRDFEPAIIQCGGIRDAAVVRKHTGIATVAPISENTFLTLAQYHDLVRRLPYGHLPFLLNDNDDAGRRWTNETLQQYRYHDLRSVLKITEFKDPCRAYESIIKNDVEDYFSEYLKQQIDGINQNIQNYVRK